ncbi:hypothetical protein C8F01DRAFT_1092627 [Mycena amicta]|nr:hypothetical protein C8F01DRAFT_1092627 [Mycena amicta]
MAQFLNRHRHYCTISFKWPEDPCEPVSEVGAGSGQKTAWAPGVESKIRTKKIGGSELGFRIPLIDNERIAELSKKTFNVYKELILEKAGLIRIVTVLTTVQRKGSTNVNVLEVEEDDGVDE